MLIRATDSIWNPAQKLRLSRSTQLCWYAWPFQLSYRTPHWAPQMTFAKTSVSYRWMQCASCRQLEPQSIAQIHLAELLKLGIKVSQATVGRYMPRRPKVPSPTWRSFLHNHLTDIAAIDMFVVAKPRTGKRNQRDPSYSQKHPLQ